MKKAFVFLFAVCLLALLVPSVQAADSGSCGEGVTWALADGTLTISGRGAMTDYASASASPWYSQRTSVKAIVIEDGVTTIGDRAFYNCTALTDVTIGESVLTIGTYAFRGCTELAQVTIPANVTELKDSAFRACTTLTVVAFGGDAPTLGSYVFNDGATSLKVEYYEGSTGYDVSPWTDYTLSAQHVGEWIVDMEATCTTDGCRHIDCAYCQTTITETVIAHHDYVGGVCAVCCEVKILESGTCGANAEWKLDALGTLTIFGTGLMQEFYNLDYIPWYNSRNSIQRVIIESGVTSIGQYAFSDCRYLTNITIPESVTRMGCGVFQSCSGLTNITIPEGVSSIQYGTFCGCSGLISVTIPDSVTSIENSAFYGCSSLTSITLPEGISSIGVAAFSDCSNLTSITIPDSVTSIENSAFSGCSSLTSITLPEGISSIGVAAFSDCSNLTNITIPDSVTSIENAVFSGCSSLTAITIPDSVTSIGDYAFDGCSSLTSITLPEGISRIAANMFSGCSSLTNIIIPKGVTSIEESAFSCCSNLTSISIPGSVTSIGNGVFFNCGYLKNVFYKGDLTGWCGITFCDWVSNPMYYADNLYINGELLCGEIVIPKNVTSLGDFVFYNCNRLTNIIIPEGITGIGDSAFCGCSALVEITIPESITSIRNGAFYGCSSLREITIPDGVTSIGDSAFSRCSSLTSVALPEGITNIGYYVFSRCSNLSSIAIPEGVTDIGSYAFENCSSLTSVVLPDTIISIGDWVFSNCSSLNSVTIPESVTRIGWSVFSECSSLSFVHYTGTEEQKSAITVYDGNGDYENAQWHYDISVSEKDGQTVYYCPECDLHYLSDGSKLSKEPSVTLTGSGFSLSFEDEILVNFYYTVSEITDVTEQGMLVFYADPGKADFKKADDVYTDSRYVESSGSYIVTTHGIAAKEMGDDRYYCAYAKLSDGSYAYSKLYQYSPKKYAMNMLGKDTTSDKQKALCVAMLNYGAAAQSYFGYNTDNLMNAELTDEQRALVKAYDASLFVGAVNADPNKIGGFTATATGFSSKSATVSFEGAFSINYYFALNDDPDAQVIFYYWTPEDYENSTTLSPKNASGSIVMEDSGDGSYYAQISGIAAKELDETYYVAVVYYSDLELRSTGVIAYSLSKYCLSKAVDGNKMQELASATAMYGYYSKNFFA